MSLSSSLDIDVKLDLMEGAQCLVITGPLVQRGQCVQWMWIHARVRLRSEVVETMGLQKSMRAPLLTRRFRDPAIL